MLRGITAGFWEEGYSQRPYYQSGKTFSDYEPAYRCGWECAARIDYRNRRFEEVESDLERGWDMAKGETRQKWFEVREATRDAFNRVRGQSPPRGRRVRHGS